MFQKFTVKAFSAAAVLLSVGCTTAPNHIFRPFYLDNGRSIATDASQRVIINTKTHPSSRPGRVNPERIVCAEPSPDVASIVANTFGFGLNILGKGNAAVSGGQASALAQLAERTVTVQLLRDQMYRACEAYANGAISGTEYSLLMSRNNDSMVTLMLGESASRLVGRQLASLTAEAGSESEATMPTILEAMENLVEASESESEAQDELTDAVEDAGQADAAAAGTDSDDSETAIEEVEETNEETENDLNDAEDEADDAKQEADAARAEAKNILKTTATPGGGGGFQELNEYAVGIAEQLTEMQEQFLDQGAEEHFISACVVELGRTSKQYSDYNDYYSEWPGDSEWMKDKNGNVVLNEEGEKISLFYDKEKRIVFTRKDYTPLQQQLINDLAMQHNVSGDIQYHFIAEVELSMFQKRALDWYYGLTDKEKFNLWGDENEPKLPKKKKKNGNVIVYFEGSKLEDVREVARRYRGYLDQRIAFIESLDDEESIEVFGQALRDSFEDEFDWMSRLTSSDRKRTDRIMRATFAIEDRERASFLAKVCLDWMKGTLIREHKINQSRTFFDFVEDVETIRNHTSQGTRSPGVSDGNSNPKLPSPDVTAMYEDYLACNKKTDATDKEICRIRVVGKYYGSNSSPKPNGAGAIEALSGSHVVQFATYDSKPKLDEGWNKIEAKLGDDLTKDWKRHINETKVGGKTKYELQLGPFKSNDAGKEYCKKALPKITSIGGQCITKKAPKKSSGQAP